MGSRQTWRSVWHEEQMRLKICDGCESSSLHTYVTKGPSRRKRDWTPRRPAVGTWSASPSRLALSLMRKLNCTRATRYSRKPNWASVSSICKLLYPSTKHCFPQQLVLRRRFLLFSYSVSIILGDSSADAAAWPVQHLTPQCVALSWFQLPLPFLPSLLSQSFHLYSHQKSWFEYSLDHTPVSSIVLTQLFTLYLLN